MSYRSILFDVENNVDNEDEAPEMEDIEYVTVTEKLIHSETLKYQGNSKDECLYE